MHRPLAQDSDQLERFRREARSVAQLNHPHIVGVIDAGEDDGLCREYTTASKSSEKATEKVRP